MSCCDCLRLFFPSSYQFTQPTYELEELVIVNNNNTMEKTYLKSDNYLNLKPINNIYMDNNLEEEDEEIDLIYMDKTTVNGTSFEDAKTIIALNWVTKNWLSQN